MVDEEPFEVEIRASACKNNPVVKSKLKKQRTWVFDSRDEAEKWAEDLNKLGTKEIVLKKETKVGAVFPDAHIVAASAEKRRRSL